MKTLTVFLLLLWCSAALAQSSGSIVVKGDINRFYPVTWSDLGWSSNEASEITIGRSSIHVDATNRGTIIATFRYHTTNWGNLSGFIDADIYQEGYATSKFVAAYADGTTLNANSNIIIWLRGGNTTYFYKSKHNLTVAVYDGVTNPLPFQEQNGPAHTYKTAIDPSINTRGITKTGSAYFNGSGNNVFLGNVGIGTNNPTDKLAVNGNIRAKEVKVEISNWPDYVFAKEHTLMSLAEIETHIKEKGHLPGLPSAAEAEADGVQLGEMNKKLLEKIEELTLYLIQQQKRIEQLENKNSK